MFCEVDQEPGTMTAMLKLAGTVRVKGAWLCDTVIAKLLFESAVNHQFFCHFAQYL